MQANNTVEKKKKEPKTTTVKVDGFSSLDSYIDSIALSDKIPSERDPTRVMVYPRFKEGDKKHLNITTVVCFEERVDEKTGLPTGEPIGFCPDFDWAVCESKYGQLTASINIINPEHEQNVIKMDKLLLDTFTREHSKYLTTDAQKMVMENKFIPPEEKVKLAKGWQRQSIKYTKDQRPDVPPYRFQYELPRHNENPLYNATIVDKNNEPISPYDVRGKEILAARYTKNFAYFQEDKFGWANKWTYIKIGDPLPEKPKSDVKSRVTKFFNVQRQMDQLCEEDDDVNTSKKRKEYDGMPELDKQTYESMNALEQPPNDD
jgi:hypothetical protein